MIQYKEAPAPTKGDLGNLSNLETTAKSSAVAAINEVANSIVKPITIDLDTVTNTSGSYTHTTTISTTGLITEGMKCIGLEVGNPAAFGDMPTITAGNDEITLSCSSVSGTSTVKVTMMRTTQATSSGIMPTAVTSEEFDILADRIGDIDDLETTAKTDVVAAVNELNTASGQYNTAIGGLSYSVTQLNDKMAKQRITPTAGTNVTIVTHCCYTVSNIACINISFTMTADASSTEYLITGLPTPPVEVPVIAVRNLTAGGSQAMITVSGGLKNSWDSFANGKTYFVNCCYAI